MNHYCPVHRNDCIGDTCCCASLHRTLDVRVQMSENITTQAKKVLRDVDLFKTQPPYHGHVREIAAALLTWVAALLMHIVALLTQTAERIAPTVRPAWTKRKVTPAGEPAAVLYAAEDLKESDMAIIGYDGKLRRAVRADDPRKVFTFSPEYIDLRRPIT